MSTRRGTHEDFLRQTFALAEQAHARGDEPFGAVLVVDGDVVLTASNTVILENDPTRHAELNLVSEGARTLPRDVLRAATLYASTEPCAMCAGAISRVRVPKVVYGCSGQGLRDLIGGGMAVPCRQILQRPHRSIEVLGPLLEEEGLALHRKLKWWGADSQVAVVGTGSLGGAIEQSHAALGAILKGDPSVYQALYSPADDVTLGNPFGPYVRGRQRVERTLARAASHYRDGEVVEVELIAKYVSETLACVVEVERGRAKVGGADEVVPVAVRVTSVFRLEGGSWKLLHRHADPITSPRPAASVISK